MTDLELTTSRHIKAPVERVFEAWLNPQLLMQFMLPADGMSVAEANSDGVEGGRFSIVMQSPDQQFPHGGEYLEISRYTRLVFTWESPFSVDGSTVTLTFAEHPQGGTELTLHHLKFPDQDSRNNHEMGWTRILQMLNQTLT